MSKCTENRLARKYGLQWKAVLRKAQGACPLKLGTCSFLRKFEHVPNLRAFFFGYSATMKKKEMAYFFFFGGYTLS